MAGNQYAVCGESYRAVSPGETVEGEEVRVTELPPSVVLAAVNADRVASVSAQLRASDWTMMPDSGLSQEKVQEWMTYRNTLRELPNQAGFPDCVWPTPPSE